MPVLYVFNFGMAFVLVWYDVTAQTMDIAHNSRNILQPTAPSVDTQVDDNDTNSTTAGHFKCPVPHEDNIDREPYQLLLEILRKINIIDASETYSIESAMKNVLPVDGNNNILQVGLVLTVKARKESTVMNMSQETSSIDLMDIMRCVHLPPSTTVGPSLQLVTEGDVVERSSNSTSHSSAPRNELKGRRGRLKKTQIMAISTCSTVIGLFFIVAIIMRVRNYLSRVRRTSLDGWPSRSTSILSKSVISGNGGGQQARPAPTLAKGVPEGQSKNCAQMKYQTKAPTSRQGVRPKCLTKDNNPLLVVTSASTPNSPSLGTDDMFTCYADDEITQDSTHSSHEEVPLLSSRPSSETKDEADHTDTVVVEMSIPDHHPADIPPTDPPTTADNACYVPEWVSELQSKLKEIGDQEIDDGQKTDKCQPSICDPHHPLHSVLHSGLTQSDSSLESQNRSYSYGNQQEYEFVPTMDVSMGYSPVCPRSPFRAKSEQNTQNIDDPSQDELDQIPKCLDLIENVAPLLPDHQDSSCQGDGDEDESSPLVSDGSPRSTQCSVEPDTEESDTPIVPQTDDSPPQDNKKVVSFDVSDRKQSVSDSPTHSNNGVVRDRNKFLQGPEFDGMEPTYV